jgi:CSLREA domain-containing protein
VLDSRLVRAECTTSEWGAWRRGQRRVSILAGKCTARGYRNVSMRLRLQLTVGYSSSSPFFTRAGCCRKVVSNCEMARLFTIRACAILLMMIVTRSVSYATEIRVTTTSAGDASKCTLRDAIVAANTDQPSGGCSAGAGADIVILGEGETYSFGESDGVTVDDGVAVPNALPSLTSEISIQGNGSTIRRNNRTAEFRLLHISGAGVVRIDKLTFRYGRTPPGIGSTNAGPGGCIFNGGHLVLTDSTVTECGTGASADQGGDGASGGNGGGIANVGTLTLVRCRVALNTTGHSEDNGSGGFGGGIFNEGTLVLESSEVSANVTGGGPEYNTDVGGNGGGVCNIGNLESKDAVVCDNRTGFGQFVGGAGGGLFNQGFARLTHVTVCDNTTGGSSGAGSGGDGGGIANGGELVLETSRITGNESGGGIRPDVGARGGGIYNGGRATIGDTVIASNRAGDGAVGGDGGALYNVNCIEIANSVISRNTAGWGAGDHGGEGGGIYNSGDLWATNCTITQNLTRDNRYGGSGGGILTTGTLVLASCTLSRNAATGLWDLGWAGQAVGGGIAVVTGTTEIANTIMAGNYAVDGAPECAGIVTSFRFGLLGDPGGCSVVGSTEGSITGLFPLLGPLEDNGGPVPTEALLAGSPAVDAGDPNGCTDAHGYPLECDARGAPRVSVGDRRCDIGAYEFGSAPPVLSCPGDCNGDSEVSVDELILGVNISLGDDPVTECPAFDTDGDGSVTVNELVAAVNAALNGCPR